MSIISPLLRRFARFGRDTRAMVSVEAAIMAPLLVFFMSMIYVTFDIFRFDATNSKAAYTVGDLLSRETEPVNQTYINGVKKIFDYITLADASKTWIRVTVVRFDGDDEEFKLVWSHAAGNVAVLTSSTLSTVTNVIPVMAEEDTVILVETFMPYKVPLRVGMRDFSYHNKIITRPRFATQLKWTNANS